jgi:rhodanese-related sulfurtransferase
VVLQVGARELYPQGYECAIVRTQVIGMWQLAELYPPGYHSRMARLVDIQTLHARHADGAFVLDVREPAEYVTGHVPGAVLAPMSRITSALGPVPRDRVVHVICQSGNRSRSMADLLTSLGYDAVSVEGGTAAWVAAGWPVVRGPLAA